MASDAPFETLDLSGLTEPERVAFYGALFAMSAGDGHISAAESDRITESLDLTGLSAEARREVLSQAIRPFPLERYLLVLKGAPAEIRRSLMLNLIDVVLADGTIEASEHVGLHLARQVLGLPLAEVSDLHEVAHALQRDPRSQGARRPIRADGPAALGD